MRIAIVGSGIAGLTCAHLLHRAHDITVFEAEDRPGGHAHTVDEEMSGVEHPVDTGFVVYNETTYPKFVRLLARLGVESVPTEMSFSVHCERSGLEYNGHSLNTLFAQRRNLLRPGFLRMIRDILRFGRQAEALLREGEASGTLGELLDRGGYSVAFRDLFLLPMGAAIWSCSPDRVLAFPAAFFLRFFRNHGLLGPSGHLPWRVIRGGSRTYVEALVRPFRERIRLGAPVRRIVRRPDGVEVTSDDGGAESFDRAILALHADQALAVLADADARERDVLAAFPYQRNQVTLHTDGRMLPRSPRARASWNYRIPRRAAGRVQVTYDMRRLQRLPAPEPFCVTLNRNEEIDPTRVRRSLEYSHPLFLAASPTAQRRHAEIDGLRRTHFCGAYWGNGFHEDGVRSALAVCRSLGTSL